MHLLIGRFESDRDSTFESEMVRLPDGNAFPIINTVADTSIRRSVGNITFSQNINIQQITKRKRCRCFSKTQCRQHSGDYFGLFSSSSRLR